jgi:hypothetical protein
MPTAAIVPTITQRVRFFLAGQGATLRPWTGLQETYDELYALLRRRRSDPEFWQPLKGLLQEVIDNAADSQRRDQAELLTSWKVDELVDKLRDALPADAISTGRSDFTRTLSTAVLGGFLLLGLAACGDDSATPSGRGSGGAVGSGGQITMVGGAGGAGMGGAGGTTVVGAGGTSAGGTGGRSIGGAGGRSIGGAGGTGAGGGIGGAGGIGSGGAGGVAVDATYRDAAALDLAVDSGTSDIAALDSGPSDTTAVDEGTLACTQTVDPELDRAIGESTISESQKEQLCQCFSALSMSWTTSLTQLFATATPEEVSRMLSGLTSCCSSNGIMTLHGLNADPSSTDLDRIKNGSAYLICAAVVYKGVSFPD